MKKLNGVVLVVAALLAASLPLLSAQQETKSVPKDSSDRKQYSGTYTFLKEGEYVQITVEDTGQVTGFISRFDNAGNPSGDENGTFVDQFFKSGKLDSGKLTFTTKPLHDQWFEFAGTINRGDGKDPGDEAYYVLKGTLTENTTGSDKDKKLTSHAQQVTFKMFPEAESAPKN